MSKGQKFAPEIEELIDTPLLRDVPEFEPQVPKRFMDVVLTYEERDQKIVMPVLESLSMVDQRVKHRDEVFFEHNNAIRNLQKKNIEREAEHKLEREQREKEKKEQRSSWSNVIWCLVGGITSAFFFALFAHYIPPAQPQQESVRVIQSQTSK